MLSIARKVAHAEQAEDLLHRENREVVELAARIDEGSAAGLAVLKHHLGELAYRFRVADLLALAGFRIKHAGRRVDRVGRPLPHRRDSHLDAAGGRLGLGDLELGDLHP